MAAFVSFGAAGVVSRIIWRRIKRLIDEQLPSLVGLQLAAISVLVLGFDYFAMRIFRRGLPTWCFVMVLVIAALSVAWQAWAFAAENAG